MNRKNESKHGVIRYSNMDRREELSSNFDTQIEKICCPDWPRVLLAFALALPVLLLPVVDAFLKVDVLGTSIEYLPALTAFVGALWGTTLGVLRHNLLKAFLGLNAGAAYGYFFGLGVCNGYSGGGTSAIFLLCGGSLCGIINMELRGFFQTYACGFMAGIMSFGIFLLALMITPTLRDATILSIPRALILLAGTLALLWLMLDFLPELRATSSKH